MSNRWSTGLFDCLSDMETCCTPEAVLLGQQNKIINGSDFCTCPCCCYGCMISVPQTMFIAKSCAACMCVGPNRQALKEKLGITVRWMWSPYAPVMCQMGRELKARGVYTMEQLNGQLPSTLAPSNMQMVKQR